MALPRRRSAGSTAPEKNPFPAITKWWKERGERMEAKAAKAITADRAQNEKKICDVLSDIDFTASKIPPEILNAKTNPQQPYGDLQLSAIAIQQSIFTKAQIDINTNQIDTVLLQLSESFKDAVANGHIKTAFAAKAGLVTCIQKIRDEIPNISNKKDAETFVENAVKYMRTWPLMVEESRKLDKQTEAYHGFIAQEQKTRQSIDSLKQNFRERLKSEADFADAVKFWKTRTMNDVSPSELTDIRKDVRHILTTLLFQEACLKFVTREAETSLKMIEMTQQWIDMLYIKTNEVVDYADPNELEKVMELINESVENMNRADVMIAEAVDALEQITTALDEMSKNPGELKLNAAAHEKAEKLIEEIIAEENATVQSNEARINAALRGMGIPSEEEKALARMKAQLEAKQQQELYEQKKEEIMRQYQQMQAEQQQAQEQSQQQVQQEVESEEDQNFNY